MRIGTNIENLKETFNKFKKYNLTFIKCNHINKDIAILLEKGFPVIRVSGPMEFGPRALGNRSILCNASDPDINESLNKKLKRSEFMPFAPITLIDDFEKLYKNNNSTILNLPYMTSTLDVKEKMIQESPASVHIDETARPQMIDKKLYPDLHEILCEYKNLTGKSSLINTSFNMHEEPIVCDVNDAMRAFISSNLPYIAINNYLIKNNEISK